MRLGSELVRIDQAAAVLRGRICDTLASGQVGARLAQAIIEGRHLLAELRRERRHYYERRVIPEDRWGTLCERVAAEFDVPAMQLRLPDRTREVVLARRVAMHLMRSLGGFSSPRLGRWFGVHHVAVLHGMRKVRERMAADEQFRQRVERLLEGAGS